MPDDVHSLSDRIFPQGPARDGNILRLEFVESWESQLIGLGRLTAFLTPRLLQQSHAVDDIGLNVIFMQRHRVEVGLKLLLERAEAKPTNTHKILDILETCGRAVTGKGLCSEWDRFVAMQAAFIDLMHKVDSGAATYRYPVNKDSQPWQRPRFVDLEELEVAGASLQDAILNLIARLEYLEPIPVAPTEASDTAQELHQLATACRRCIQTQRRILTSIRGEGERVFGDIYRRDRRSAPDDHTAAEVVAEVTMALATRVERMRDRIAAAHELELGQVPEDTASPLPPLRLMPNPPLMRAQQDAQIRWMADEMRKMATPLGKALEASYKRSANWSGPAARQLHFDIGRFRSRFLRNWEMPAGSGEQVSPVAR